MKMSSPHQHAKQAADHFQDAYALSALELRPDTIGDRDYSMDDLIFQDYIAHEQQPEYYDSLAKNSTMNGLWGTVVDGVLGTEWDGGPYAGTTSTTQTHALAKMKENPNGTKIKNLLKNLTAHREHAHKIKESLNAPLVQIAYDETEQHEYKREEAEVEAE